jgi:6-pyruvoyltetrahydropterin/6-carboxytetrahydropterin synthase
MDDESFTVFTDYELQCAHWLPHVPDGHMCGDMHGHTYRVRLYVGGSEIADSQGWVLDYADVDSAFAEEVHATLDHSLLNEVPGLNNPTCELIARWMWERLQPRLPGLRRIDIGETCRAGVMYIGPRVGR